MRRASAHRMRFRFNFQTAKNFRTTNPLRASLRATIGSRLAAPCARVVESRFHPKEGVVTPCGRGNALRAWGMPGAQSTRSLVRTRVKGSQRTSIHSEGTGTARHSRTRWCYGLCRALLGEVLCCPRHPADERFRQARSGGRASAEFTASVRGRTTRFNRPPHTPLVLRSNRKLTGAY
jgi:hypothetical protein